MHGKERWKKTAVHVGFVNFFWTAAVTAAVQKKFSNPTCTSVSMHGSRAKKFCKFYMHGRFFHYHHTA